MALRKNRKHDDEKEEAPASINEAAALAADTGPHPSDVTNPDHGQGAVMAAVDHHEAAAKGEANPPPSSAEPPAVIVPPAPVSMKGLPKYAVKATKVFSFYGAIQTWTKGDVRELTGDQLARAKDAGVELEEVK